MLRGEVADLNSALSLDAARISLDTGLAMADSIILATARSREAVLWTQDAYFEGLAGVEFRPERSGVADKRFHADGASRGVDSGGKRSPVRRW